MLKACATDTLAQAHAERLTYMLAHKLRIDAPTVHVVACLCVYQCSRDIRAHAT